MHKIFKSGILLIIFHLAAVQCSCSQNYYPNLYHNLLPYNAAYAGEDTTSIVLSTFFGVEEISENYRGLEFSASHDLKKFNSGLGVMAHRNVLGKRENFFELTENQVSLIYNYKIRFNETSWMRLGLKVNENIRTYYFTEIYSLAPYTITLHKDTSFDYISFDPAVWFSCKDLQVGFSMKNVLKAKVDQVTMPAGYTGIITYRVVKRDKLKVIFATLYQHQKNQSTKIQDLIPELTFDVGKALILDCGMHFISYKNNGYNSSGNSFLAGIGVRFSPNIKLLANYDFQKENLNKRIAATLKCSF